MRQSLHGEHTANVFPVVYSQWRREGEAKDETSHVHTALAAWLMTPIGSVMKQPVRLRLLLAISSVVDPFTS